MNVKKEEKKNEEEDDKKKNVCYKSLFFLYWRKEDRKGFGSSALLGIFMYLKTALGLREKNRALYLLFVAVPFISPSFGCLSEWRPPSK